MALAYTTEQLQAIRQRGKNLLVAAAAGSGKTAVLTERVAAHVREGTPLERLVVLTFTDAAAREMKERIADRLYKEPASENITRALEALDTAHIRTFDSYALFIVRKYGHLNNISRHVRIADQVQTERVKQQIIDTIFDEHYAKESPSFLAYVATYETKDDENLKKQIRYFHERLMLNADYDVILDEATQTSHMKTRFDAFFKQYEHLALERIDIFNRVLSDLENRLSHERSLAYLSVFRDACHDVLNAQTYEDIHEAVSRISQLPNSSGATRALGKEAPDEQTVFVAGREKLSQIFKEMKSTLCEKTRAEHFTSFCESRTHLPIIATLIRDFHSRISAWQREHELFDYAGIAQCSLELLKAHPAIAQALKTAVDEVLIDEYQDTNGLQEAFVSRMTEDNVYMVGDIKQSIYRFRYADVGIFTNKYGRYRSGDGGALIDLNVNFRARKSVLDPVNILFDGVMDEAVGGVDYRDNQALVFGQNAYCTHRDPKSSEGLSVHVLSEEITAQKTEETGLSAHEIEIFHIAEDIRRRMSETTVYDRADNLMRPPRYSDFAILNQVSTEFDTIKKIFTHHGIPLNVVRDDRFLRYDDIHVYRHLIKAVYALQNPEYYRRHFKHSLLSLARSYLFDIDDNALIAAVHTLPDTPRAVAAHLESTELNGLFKALSTVQERNGNAPLDMLWQDIVETLDLSKGVLALPMSESAAMRLDYLTQLIGSLSETGYYLKDLVQYFDDIISEGLDIQFDRSSATTADAVRLMTIHKAKGLEFPVVYLPHVSRGFNRSRGQSYAFDRHLGFLLEHGEEGLEKSFIYTLMAEKELSADLSERLRLLYVALTRAREACIVTMVERETKPITFDEQGRVTAYDRLKMFKSMQNIFEAMMPRLEDHIERYSPDTLELTDYQTSRPPLVPKHVVKTVAYEPLPKPVHAREGVSFSAGIDDVLTPERLEYLELGERFHHLFELIDFSRATPAQIARLARTDMERETMTAFFNDSLITSLDIVKAYKEFPFALDEDDITYSGYIDLLLETPDKFVIIDYKLKDVNKAVYTKQIEGYAKVLKAIDVKAVEGYLYSLLDRRFKKVV